MYICISRTMKWLHCDLLPHKAAGMQCRFLIVKPWLGFSRRCAAKANWGFSRRCLIKADLGFSGHCIAKPWLGFSRCYVTLSVHGCGSGSIVSSIHGCDSGGIAHAGWGCELVDQLWLASQWLSWFACLRSLHWNYFAYVRLHLNML